MNGGSVDLYFFNTILMMDFSKTSSFIEISACVPNYIDKIASNFFIRYCTVAKLIGKVCLHFFIFDYCAKLWRHFQERGAAVAVGAYRVRHSFHSKNSISSSAVRRLR